MEYRNSNPIDFTSSLFNQLKIHMKNLFKSTLLSCVTLLFIGCGESNAQQTITETSKQQSKNLTKRTYTLQNFKQSCCSKIVDYSLKEVEGYIKSEANIDHQQITVWYDSSKATEDQIKQAINQTAYKIE
ncbi:hypothetical protein UJ101_00477 [Flavobacteriaceae bacterium UJ101]|nr:hypothetical protein UJ101_00477 [Flavobacteriaceae bacterium UJ101]